MKNMIILKTSMRCSSCVDKVKPALLAKNISDSLEFNMQSPDRTLSFKGTHVQGEEAIKILHELGYSSQLLNSSEASKNFFETYKPLILIGFYIIGVTALVEIKIGSFELMRVMNNFMGGFFIFFSFFKLLNLTSFAVAYSTYDIIARKNRVYGLIYPFIELGLGVAFVLEISPIVTNIITIIIMTIGNIGVWNVLRKKQTIQCACLGTIFQLPMTNVTLFENSLMILMALFSLVLLRT